MRSQSCDSGAQTQADTQNVSDEWVKASLFFLKKCKWEGKLMHEWKKGISININKPSYSLAINGWVVFLSSEGMPVINSPCGQDVSFSVSFTVV